MDKDIMAMKLQHYRDLVDVTWDRILLLPTRAKRFTDMYREFGPEYLAKRTWFRTTAHFEKDRYIDYSKFKQLNTMTPKQIHNQKMYAREHTDGNKFLVYICTDGATDAAIARTKNSIVHQTMKPVKALTGRAENMAKRVREVLAMTDPAKLWILKLQAGDELSTEFFYRIARYLENSDADLVYTDHDVWPELDSDDKEIRPFFKPDYSAEYLCSFYYIGPSYVTRGDVWDKYADIADDELFVLSVAADTDRLGHIHRMLYSEKQSDREQTEKPDYTAEKEALITDIYMEPGISGVEITRPYGDVRNIRVHWDTRKKISVIIPNMNHAEDLYTCMKALSKQTVLEDLEIIICENNSDLAETFALYKWLLDGEKSVHLEELTLDDAVREKLSGHVKVVYWEGGTEFNYSALNNFARKSATGDYLLLLNNDVELINEDALEIMLGACRRENVGAVGAKLFYSDETIQHAGVIIGFGGVAAHSFAGADIYNGGYMHQADCERRLSAVTAACMMLPASVYDEMGGLDEKYSVAFNDVDLCMRICKSGRKILYHPGVRGWHYESKSRGEDKGGKRIRRFASEINRFIEHYNEDILAGDPYYNHNLSLIHNDYSYRDPYWFDKDF